MFDIIITLFGVIGLFLVGSSVLLETLNKLPKDHKIFILLNFFGCALLVINAYFTEAYVFLFLNIFLIFINLYGILRVYKILK